MPASDNAPLSVSCLSLILSHTSHIATYACPCPWPWSCPEKLQRVGGGMHWQDASKRRDTERLPVVVTVTVLQLQLQVQWRAKHATNTQDIFSGSLESRSLKSGLKRHNLLNRKTQTNSPNRRLRKKQGKSLPRGRGIGKKAKRYRDVRSTLACLDIVPLCEKCLFQGLPPAHT